MGKLVVGVPHGWPSVVTLPYDLAATSPILAEAGVTVEVVEGRYRDLSDWLASGRIDLCRRGPDVDVVAAAGGAPLVCCAVAVRAVPARVVVNRQIGRPSDLVGRRVAVIDPTMGSTLALQTWLAHEGVDLDQIDVDVLGGTPQRLAAVASGAAAATVVTAPSYFTLPPEVRTAAELDQALGPFVFSGVQVHRTVAENRKDDIAAYLAAVIGAVDRILDEREDPDRIAALMRVDTGIAAAAMDRARTMAWYPRAMAFEPSATTAMLNALKRFGHVPEEFDADSWIWQDARTAAVELLHRG